MLGRAKIPLVVRPSPLVQINASLSNTSPPKTDPWHAKFTKARFTKRQAREQHPGRGWNALSLISPVILFTATCDF